MTAAVKAFRAFVHRVRFRRDRMWDWVRLRVWDRLWKKMCRRAPATNNPSKGAVVVFASTVTVTVTQSHYRHIAPSMADTHPSTPAGGGDSRGGGGAGGDGGGTACMHTKQAWYTCMQAGLN